MDFRCTVHCAGDCACSFHMRGDLPIGQLQDLARAVIEAPTFQVAQQVLHGVPPEFAVRKALELASMVLSTDDDAAENFAAQTGGPLM